MFKGGIMQFSKIIIFWSFGPSFKKCEFLDRILFRKHIFLFSFVLIHIPSITQCLCKEEGGVHLCSVVHDMWVFMKCAVLDQQLPVYNFQLEIFNIQFLILSFGYAILFVYTILYKMFKNCTINLTCYFV